MKRRHFLGSMAAAPLLRPVFRKPKNTPIDVGNEKQLLIDDLFFEVHEGIRLTINPPRKTGEHLVVCDRPWEDWFIAQLCTIKDDDGTYKMWFSACHQSQRKLGVGPTGFDPALSASDLATLCYVTSTDGVHWEKPNLGLFDYGGSRQNNIVLRPQAQDLGACVFKDPSAPPEERYKLIYGDSKYPWKTPTSLHGTYGSICGATSPDGIHWTPVENNPIMPWYKDNPMTAFWDDRIQKCVAYIRYNDWTVPGQERFRRIGRSETGDFRHWPAPTMVLAPDGFDPPQTDLYNAAAIKYPYAANAYFMFPSPFYKPPIDRLDAQLAVSRDGVTWQRVGDRQAFIPTGLDGAFDAHQIRAGVGITREGDKLSLYYYGHNVGHDATNEVDFDSVFSRVVLQLDRFMSANADYRGGTFTTPLLTFGGSRLELNVDTGAGGTVQVEIRDADGKSEKSDIVNGNSVRKKVSWQGNGNLGAFSGKPVRLKFVMRDTKLYAFQFAD